MVSDAAVRHRVARVQRHVQHRGLERRRIGKGHAGPAARVGHDANRRAERPAQQPHDARDQCVDVDRLRVQQPAAGKRQQVAGQILPVQRRAHHGVDDLPGVRVAGKMQPQELDVAEDDRQDVVEVVRDAAGQLADGFHLLRPEQRFLRLLQRLVRALQLGDVVRDAVDAENLAVLVAIDALGHKIRPLARRAGRDPFERLGFAAGEHLPVGLDEAARVFFRIELEVVPADDVGGRLADEARECLVDEDVPALEILDEDLVRRRLDHRLQDVVAVRDRHHVSRALRTEKRYGSFSGLEVFAQV